MGSVLREEEEEYWFVCSTPQSRDLKSMISLVSPDPLSEGNMRPRLVTFLIVLFLLPSLAHAGDPFSLSGTVTNTTNPGKPISASATISFDGGNKCVLRIGAPLYGSGSCSVEKFDDARHSLSISSTGPTADIACTGTLDGNVYRGTYVVVYPNFPELAQRGNFSLTYDEKPVLLEIENVLTKSDFTTDGKEFHVLIDRDFAVFFDKDYKYVGIRVLLDGQQNPVWRIEDHKDGSLYIDPKSNKTLMEWHTDGNDGYFSKASDGVTMYYDRFMNYTLWSSVDVQGGTVYAHENGDSVELYDSSFKSLNIRGGKTSTGKVFWMKTDTDGIAEYFDDSMNSLHWYSAVREGQTYYAHLEGKKFKVYDANFQPIRRKNGFWSNMAHGFAVGLAAYGQALQSQAAAARQTDTYARPDTSYNTTTQQIGGFGYSNTNTSDGSYYNTTTQRIGNFDYSNTTGSNGYYASTTRQKIGNFGYVSGFSSNGSISGTQQRIGNFDYSTYVTPEGQWNETSQQIGNFTYHTFTAPDGSMHTGTSQQIGDFVYTSIR